MVELRKFFSKFMIFDGRHCKRVPLSNTTDKEALCVMIKENKIVFKFSPLHVCGSQRPLIQRQYEPRGNNWQGLSWGLLNLAIN